MSTPAFAADALARQRSGAEPGFDVAEALLAAARAALAAAAGVPPAALPPHRFRAAQRWGAALAPAPLAVACVGDAASAFAACGDFAAGGGGALAAVRSGAAAAALVADALA